MEIGVFHLPTIGDRQQLEQGMAGSRTDLYQSMFANLAEEAHHLDEHGYCGVAFTEHHFHIEGEEGSTNPVMLDLFIDMQTKRLRVVQCGLLLPCHDPLRIAEDFAILDQMTQGRAFAGFARGYQPRWVNTLGPHHATLADSDGDPAACQRFRPSSSGTTSTMRCRRTRPRCAATNS